MSGPIIYIALLALLVTLPAIAGWKLSRKYEQFPRMAGAILGGQLLLTPGMAIIAFSGAAPISGNPLRTVIIYAAMALVISIMTFVILEMKNGKQGA